MAEEKEKSLDQQIKEAELAKLKAETADVEKSSKQARVMGVPIVQIIFGGIVVGFVLLNYIQPLVNLNTQKANLQADISTKESTKGQLEDWIMRLKLDSTNISLKQLADSLDIQKKQLVLLNETLKIETEDLEKKNKLAEKNLVNVEKRISALKAQEKELLATIASEKIKVIITKAFPLLKSEEYSNVLEKYQMIRAKNYYDRRLNPEGKGIDNQFEPQAGDSVIFAAATGLTWQQSGSTYISLLEAEEYIQKINAETYGGYSDWRLPTLEEAMALMKPEQNNRLYIAGQFDKKIRSTWTSDKFSVSFAWVVYFNYGYCNNNFIHSYKFVRAVR